MKSVRFFLWLCAICMLAAPLTYAQNGAWVGRGEFATSGFFWDEENLLVMISSDTEAEADFGCGSGGDVMYYHYMDVYRPDGSIIYSDHAAFFTQVFYATADDFTEEDGFLFLNEPCAFWNNGGLMLAEGITHYSYHDNDVFPLDSDSNRRNSWREKLAGTLYDYEGICGGDMVDVNMVWKFLLKKNRHTCDPDCIDKAVIIGPRRNCP